MIPYNGANTPALQIQCIRNLVQNNRNARTIHNVGVLPHAIQTDALNSPWFAYLPPFPSCFSRLQYRGSVMYTFKTPLGETAIGIYMAYVLSVDIEDLT